LRELNQIIDNLKKDLEIALDRIGDAEDGAIALLDQNTELYNNNKKLDELTTQLRNEIGKMEKRAALQPFVWFGGVGIGAAGGYFLVDGLVNANKDKTLIGVGIIGTDILIYSLGKFVFKWW